MSTKPLINVLIRTSNRPKGFQRAYESVLKQTYPHVHVWVAYDNDEAARYIPNSKNVTAMKMSPDKTQPYYWNLYLNTVLNKIYTGWCIILDDDDFIEKEYALEEAERHLKDPLHVFIFQFSRCGKLKPPVEHLKQGIVERGKIGMPCIMIHSLQASKFQFDGKKAADYRYIKQVTEHFHTKFIPHVIVHTDNKGLGGEMES